MILRNNMEDLVQNIVEVLLQDADNNFWSNENHKYDLICYVLNRVKPKYITSGRGILHYESNMEKNVQESVDVFSIAAEGMRLIENRRKVKEEKTDLELDKKVDKRNSYYNFPCIIGKIISMKTWAEIHDVTVTLKHKIGTEFYQTAMINSQWNNPYTISEKTDGYFTFYPSPIQGDSEAGESKQFDFLLIFESDKFPKVEKIFTLESKLEKNIQPVIQRGAVHRIENVFIMGD